ncbi:uncharacterized protein [Oscarella lobularis]|uniref:uncharacterized protein n=1 Tax=Oscarella lobularis TaxID=121494 RepID=UPI003313F670
MRFVLLAIVVLVPRISVDATSCAVAQRQCFSNSTCLASFMNYSSECGKALVSGQASDCTSACRAALAHLVASTDVGRLLANCTCAANNTGCVLTSKNFAAACFGASTNSSDCAGALTQCVADATCAQSFFAYSENCSLAFETGIPSDCSNACRSGFEQLNATVVGRGALSCACSSGNLTEELCALTTGNFLRSCYPGRVTEPTIPPGCDSCVDDVDVDCNADPTCRPLRNEYINQCGSAFQGLACSSACNSSYFALIGDSVGGRYVTCACVGVFAATCVSWRNGVLKTCLGRTPPSSIGCPTPTSARDTETDAASSPARGTETDPSSGQETSFRLSVTVIAIMTAVSAFLYL